MRCVIVGEGGVRGWVRGVIDVRGCVNRGMVRCPTSIMLPIAVGSTGATLVRGKWVVVVKIRTAESRSCPGGGGEGSGVG